MSTAPNYRPHYTIEDYLQWEGDWELWAGIPVAMSPAAAPEHQRIATQLAFFITEQLRIQSCCQRCVAILEVDWKVSPDTVVRPDVLITCDPLPAKHLLRPPVFIAEILSPTTAHKDRTAKRSLYESQRVPYYAIIDPEEKTAELLILENGVYPDTAPLVGPVDLRLTDDCTITVDFQSLFSHPSPS